MQTLEQHAHFLLMVVMLIANLYIYIYCNRVSRVSRQFSIQQRAVQRAKDCSCQYLISLKVRIL